jgi:hypothetical protein
VVGERAEDARRQRAIRARRELRLVAAAGPRHPEQILPEHGRRSTLRG